MSDNERIIAEASEYLAELFEEGSEFVVKTSTLWGDDAVSRKESKKCD